MIIILIRIRLQGRELKSFHPGLWMAESDRCFKLQRRVATCDGSVTAMSVNIRIGLRVFRTDQHVLASKAPIWGGSGAGVLLETRGNWYASADGDPSITLTLRARLTVLWPGGPAVTPWRGGQKPPPHKLYKHCQLDLTSTNRPVRGDTDHPRRVVAAVGHRRLHSGDARVPQSSSTIEGGEGGGAPTFVSGSERCLPRSCKLLMHFRENGTGGGRWETIRVAARPPPRNHLSSLEKRDAVEDSTRAQHSRRHGKT